MNKLLLSFIGAVAMSLSAAAQPQIQEVSFAQVHLSDGFWAPRIEVNRTVSIPSAFRECEKVCIHCYEDSYAHHFAEEVGIRFELIREKKSFLGKLFGRRG